MSAADRNLGVRLPPRLRTRELPVSKGVLAYGALGVVVLIVGLILSVSTAIVFGAASIVFATLLSIGDLRRSREGFRVGTGLLPVVQPTDDDTDGRIRTLDVTALEVAARTPGWFVLQDQTGAPYLLARPGRQAETWRRENQTPTATELGFPDDQRPDPPTLGLED